MVLRGGQGNDTIYAGGFDDDSSSNYDDIDNDSSDAAIYIYGDEGHDRLFGVDSITHQYFFGGEGDDFIQGGYHSSGDDGGLFYVNGGDGDDIIKPFLDYHE